MDTRIGRTWLAGSAAVVLALSLTACGNGDVDQAASPQEQPSSGPSAPAVPSASAEPPASTPPADESPGDKTKDTDLADAEFALSWEDALDLAGQQFDGQLHSIGVDWNLTRFTYTVQLVSDTEEYEVEIDADNGDLLTEETESLDGGDAAEMSSEIVDVKRVVPWSDALDAALNEADGRIVEWKLEGTDHGAQYQFDIDQTSGEDLEISVDAYTGEFLDRDD